MWDSSSICGGRARDHLGTMQGSSSVGSPRMSISSLERLELVFLSVGRRWVFVVGVVGVVGSRSCGSCGNSCSSCGKCRRTSWMFVNYMSVLSSYRFP